MKNTLTATIEFTEADISKILTNYVEHEFGYKSKEGKHDVKFIVVRPGPGVDVPPTFKRAIVTIDLAKF